MASALKLQHPNIQSLPFLELNVYNAIQVRKIFVILSFLRNGKLIN